MKLSSKTASVLYLALGGCAPRPAPAAPSGPPAPSAIAPRVETTRAPSPTVAAPERERVVPHHPGCMLIADLAGGEPIRLGEQDCRETTNPASTFKVPHALFALETGVVHGADDSVKWDGTEQYFNSWEQDHTLRTAIYDSVVWYFQRTAQAIGTTKMTELLRAFDYGNADPSSGIDTFWLGGGSLVLDAFDQLHFVQRLYGAGAPLPVAKEHIALVRALLVRPPSSFAARLVDGHQVPDVDEHLVFGAKTGTAMLGASSVTWMIGHARCEVPHGGPGFVFVSRVFADAPASPASPAATYALLALAQLGRLRCRARVEPPDGADPAA